jgi:methylenetetrahydrofolate dehydrogenase (NADP+)/methenyltetrahydrofolate cyclohydrolase
MTAKNIDGVALSQRLRTRLSARVHSLAEKGIRPGLAVLLVGENPASKVYVRNKIKACGDAGILSRLMEFPADATESQVLDAIRALNADPAIHGILVQLPLPPQVSEAKVIETITADKDVDGFHVQSAGALFLGRPGFEPCTPSGVMAMLDDIGADLSGKEAVVVGRSNIVGKPMAMMLLARNATVTLCTSRTRHLADHTRRADILVVATGKLQLVTGAMVKPGAVVIDVGMNRTAEGKLAGDVDFASAREVAEWITPVPGGVGPMTITMLLANTVKAAEGGLRKN